MMRNRLTVFPVIVCFVFLFLGTITAGAQDFGHGKRKEKHQNWEKRSKTLENLRMLKLMELLELSDEQDTPFIARFAEFRKDFKALMLEVESEVETLSELLKSDAEKEKIYAAIDKIANLKKSGINIMMKFHEDVKSILTAQQLGRMVIFEERFERELIEGVRGFHDRPALPPSETDEAP